MAWFTSFSTVNMNNPLFGDLQNDQFFGRADFRWLTGKQIDFRYEGSARDFVFRGDFTTNVIGATGEIGGGTFRSVTLATSNQVNWTLTGLPNLGILDALDRASHLGGDPGDLGVNQPLNMTLLAGSDRLYDDSTGNSTLNGYAGNDTLYGNEGDDSLNGGTSNDQMFGGLGNDTYVVDNVSDQVVELPGEGTSDTVQSFINNYILGDAQEGLTLLGISNLMGRGNAAANSILGNPGHNQLFGRGGNDTLNGAGGDDTMEGGTGNDSLNGAGGSDTASFLHAKGPMLVKLAIVAPQATGAGNDTLTSIENVIGSQFDDDITGNAEDNVIEGGRGNDTLGGSGGIDTASYASAKAAVTVTLAVGGVPQATGGAGTDELAGFENLSGSAFNDTLTGASSGTAQQIDNVLRGGLGNDSLTGGLGKDTFVFDTTSGTDTIADFASGVDQLVLIELDAGGNFILPLDPDGPGTPLPDEFLSGAGKTAPETADQHIIYNTTNGALYYDRDGTGFSYGTIQIATLTGAPTLDPSDIIAG